MKQRLQKIIATNHPEISRRKAETLIEQGKVKLNGVTAKLGDKASPEDSITVEGISLKKESKKEYIILNKPKGLLVTKHDPKKRKTIYNLLSMKPYQNLNYVGRLDAMSEGLLILTNDGNLQQKLTHPSHKISKVYHLRTAPVITKQHITDLAEGILLEGRKFFAKISNKNNNEFDITIQEGRNRIIRKVMQKLGYKVYQLKRIQIANIKLPINLRTGQLKQIVEKEIKI